MIGVDIFEDALAFELVRLAFDPFVGMTSASKRQAAALTKAIAPIEKAIYNVWQTAGYLTAQHVFLVKRNNLSTPVQALVESQADVRAVLKTPFEQAHSSTVDAIDLAWQKGEALGVKSANEDLKIAGLEPVKASPISKGVLKQLQSDALRNRNEARKRFLSATSSEDPEQIREAMRGVARDQARRAQYGTNVAGTHAAAEAKERALIKAAKEQGVDIWKVWVTRFGPGTCPTCASLHGLKRKLGDPFPTKGALSKLVKPPKVYGGPLNHPPRHPNCRCRIMLYLAQFDEDDGPDVDDMRERVREWFRELFRLLIGRRLKKKPKKEHEEELINSWLDL
jgi:hypothetical protein